MQARFKNQIEFKASLRKKKTNVVGRILVIIRSFEHHHYREKAQNDCEDNSLLGDLARVAARPYIRSEVCRR